MPYWLYGLDADTDEAAEPFFSSADSEVEARAQAEHQGISVQRVEQVEVDLPTFQLPDTFRPSGLNKFAGVVLSVIFVGFSMWSFFEGATDPTRRILLLVGAASAVCAVWVAWKVFHLQSFSIQISKDGISWEENGDQQSARWQEVTQMRFRASGPMDALMGAARRGRDTLPDCCTITTSTGQVRITANEVDRFLYLVKVLRVECFRHDVEWVELRGSGEFERTVDPIDLI